MKTNLFVLSLLSGVSTLAPAQIVSTATWQVSLDGGQTWHSGEVGAQPSQRDAIVRLMIGWDPATGGSAPNAWFRSTFFDTVVLGAGPGDAASAFAGVTPNGRMTLAGLSAQRQGTTIKIDRSDDAAAPGAGSGWVNVSQGGPITGWWEFGNPIEVFRYALTLDGSEGRRDLSGVWATSPQTGLALVTLTSGATQPTFENAAIIVPSPGAAGLGVVACFGLIAARRRRRGL